MSNEELAARIQAGEREIMPELWEQVRRFVAKMAARRYLLSNGYGGEQVFFRCPECGSRAGICTSRERHFVAGGVPV